MSDFVDIKTQETLPSEQPTEEAPFKAEAEAPSEAVIDEGVAEEAKLDEETLADDESKKDLAKKSSEEDEVKTSKASEEQEVETKKSPEEEEIEAKKCSGEEDVEKKPSGDEKVEEEKFDFSRNIYKSENKEANSKDNSIASPSVALPALAVQHAEGDLADAPAPLDAPVQNNAHDEEPRFPRRNRKVSKRYPEYEFEMEEPKKSRK